MERVLDEAPGIERIVQVGLRDLGVSEYQRIQSDDRVIAYFDPAIARDRLQGSLLAGFYQSVQALPQHVYLSFDIDGLDPSLCPGTGTPVPGGLSLGDVSLLLAELVRGF